MSVNPESSVLAWSSSTDNLKSSPPVHPALIADDDVSERVTVSDFDEVTPFDLKGPTGGLGKLQPLKVAPTYATSPKANAQTPSPKVSMGTIMAVNRFKRNLLRARANTLSQFVESEKAAAVKRPVGQNLRSALGASLLNLVNASVLSLVIVGFIYALSFLPWMPKHSNGRYCLTDTRAGTANGGVLVSFGAFTIVNRWILLIIVQHCVLLGVPAVKPHAKLLVVGLVVMLVCEVPWTAVAFVGFWDNLGYGAVLWSMIVPMLAVRGIFAKKLGKKMGGGYADLIRIISLPNNLTTLLNMITALFLYPWFNTWGDLSKVIFILFIQPIVWDALGAVWRYSHCQIISSPLTQNVKVFPTTHLLFRNLWTRLFSVSVANEQAALILSIGLGVLEFLMRLSVVQRDTLCWRRLFYRKKEGFPPEVARFARATTEIIDSWWEIYGIVVSFALFVCFYDLRLLFDFYSGGDYVPPDVLELFLARVLLPVAVECTGDFLIFFISIRHGVPVMEVTKSTTLSEALFAWYQALEAVCWILIFLAVYLFSLEMWCSGEKNPCMCDLPHWRAPEMAFFRCGCPDYNPHIFPYNLTTH